MGLYITLILISKQLRSVSVVKNAVILKAVGDIEGNAAMSVLQYTFTFGLF